MGLTCLLSTKPGDWEEGRQVAKDGLWVSPAFSPPSQVAGRREGRWLRAGRVYHLPSLSTKPGDWVEGRQVAKGGPWVSPAFSPPSQVAGWR